MAISLASFFLLFFLTNIVFSFVICAVFLSLKKEKNNLREYLLYSFVAGPAVTSVLVYYLLLLLPNFSYIFYSGFILVFYFTLALLTRKNLIIIIQELRNYFHQLKLINKSATNNWDKYYPLVFYLAIAYYVLLGVKNIFLKPITGHDMLEYAIQGKIFYHNVIIKYQQHLFDNFSNFYYVGLHGYGFPLLATWERIFDHYFGINSDFYFRSVTVYYGLLILLIVYYWLNKKDKFIALAGVIALYFCYGYLIAVSEFHIDTFRISLFTITLICFARAIKDINWFTVFCLGFFGGMQAFSHSIGAILIVIELGLLFLFIKTNFVDRILKIGFATLIVLFFGGIHYVLDVFYGTGWIFQNIKFY